MPVQGRVVVIVVALGVIAIAWFRPYECLSVAAALCLLVLSGFLFARKRPDGEMAVEREGESICTFVRSFDYRSKDTWILRAAYEEVYDAVGQAFPIRASDHLDEDLWIIEDFDLVVDRIAYRCKRSLEQTRTNPFSETTAARRGYDRIGDRA